MSPGRTEEPRLPEQGAAAPDDGTTDGFTMVDQPMDVSDATANAPTSDQPPVQGMPVAHAPATGQGRGT